MTIARIVEIDGEQFTLRQLAMRSGIAYPTLCRRWHTGDRGADIIRPLHPGRQTKQQIDLADMHTTRRDLKRQLRQAKLVKEEAQRARLRELREQRAALLARPLIAANLLSGEEREEIRQSIVGRQRWWTADSSYTGR